MAKHDDDGQRTKAAAAKADTATDASTTTDAMEQRVVAFAEELGRIVGAVQAKTEGWMDREALQQQIASVRDGATELLEQLKTSVANVTSGERSEPQRVAARAAAQKNRARSRSKVAAPGKKHRKPMPRDSRAVAADARKSTLRAGQPMMKTMKRRGRG
jgi:hypothetical protein